MNAAAAAEMHLVPPPAAGVVYHVGRRPNPFLWRVPGRLDLTADPPITAGNRFDAPGGDYATLYCATTRYGALLEKLSPLRPIPELRNRIDQAVSGARGRRRFRTTSSTLCKWESSQSIPRSCSSTSMIPRRTVLWRSTVGDFCLRSSGSRGSTGVRSSVPTAA